MNQANHIKMARQLRLDPKLEEQLHIIYTSSFPPSERVDFSEIVAGIASGIRWLFTVENAGKLIGFAITVPLPGTDIHLLEYMAIAAGFRGRGIGSALLRHILDTLRLTEHISGLILEVEPKEQGTQEEKALRKRRIQFYRKNGAHLVECAPRYRMPNLAGYGDVEMRLMWLPLREKDITLSGRKLRDCIIKIYRYCYSRSSDDPLLQTVLKDLAC